MSLHLSIKAKLVVAAEAKQELHQFKPHSSVRYDARTMGLGQDCYTASLTVRPKGRVTGQLQMSAKIPAPSGSLGVDLGVKRVAVTSDRKFHTAKKIRHKKACYKRTRRSLQANGSKSAKRALKRVSGRERLFVADTTRCLHLGVRPNQSDFHCPNCGLQINADLNGAKSIALRHDLPAMGRYFCEYPPKEVNRPEAVRPSAKRRQARNLKLQAPSTARPRA